MLLFGLVCVMIWLNRLWFMFLKWWCSLCSGVCVVNVIWVCSWVSWWWCS